MPRVAPVTSAKLDIKIHILSATLTPEQIFLFAKNHMYAHEYTFAYD